jgi:hypothetical protein
MKSIIIGIITSIILLLSHPIFSQEDSIKFYALKLFTTNVQQTSVKNPEDKVLNKFDSYFFFSHEGIYDADKHGIQLFKFTETPSFRYVYNEINEKVCTVIKVESYDNEAKENCLMQLVKYSGNPKYYLTIKYEKDEFLFDCQEIK